MATIISNFNMFRDPIVCKGHRKVGYEALVMKRYYRWDGMHCSCQKSKISPGSDICKALTEFCMQIPRVMPLVLELHEFTMNFKTKKKEKKNMDTIVI